MVLTVKDAVLLPAGTVTVVGRVAALLLEVRPTIVPPLPALPVSVTRPVELDPPMTVVGLRVTLERVDGVIVSEAVVEFAPSVAVRVAVVGAFTGDVVIVKLAVEAPLATVTDAGTTALVFPD